MQNFLHRTVFYFSKTIVLKSEHDMDRFIEILLQYAIHILKNQILGVRAIVDSRASIGQKSSWFLFMPFLYFL